MKNVPSPDLPNGQPDPSTFAARTHAARGWILTGEPLSEDKRMALEWLVCTAAAVVDEARALTGNPDHRADLAGRLDALIAAVPGQSAAGVRDELHAARELPRLDEGPHR